MRKLILLLFSIAWFYTGAQNTDSLLNVIHSNEISQIEQLDAYNKLCKAYLLSNPDKTMEYAKKGLDLAKKENNKILLPKFNEYLGVSFSKKAIYDTAHIYFDKALIQAIETKDIEQEASIFVSIAASQQRQHQYAQAIESYMKALPLYEKTGNDKQYVKALANIGGIYRALKNTALAVPYLDQAKTIAEKNNDIDGMSKIYYDLGIIYFESKELNKALEYETKALKLSRHIRNKSFELGCLQALAAIYLQGLDNYDKALEYGQEALTIAEEMGSKQQIAGIMNILSSIYYFQHHYKESEEAAFKAWELDSTNWARGNNIFMNITKSNIHLGNKEKAIQNLEKFEMLNQKYSDRNLQETLANMEVKYETEKKELQIVSLEKDRRFYLSVGITVLFFFLIILGLLLFRHRFIAQKRQLSETQREIAEQKIIQLEQEKQLIATQAILEGESMERSRLARDLHDGLGGMLSVTKLNLEEIRNKFSDSTLECEHFDKPLKILNETTTELRRIAHNLMPESLIHYGLKTSLNDFCLSIPGCHFHFFGKDLRIENSLETLIYRCAYELVNNSIKHANATQINVQLIIEKSIISLTIQDNGCGFIPTSITDGTGLENIRIRISAFSGKMNIHSSQEKGTEVSIEIEL